MKVTKEIKIGGNKTGGVNAYGGGGGEGGGRAGRVSKHGRRQDCDEKEIWMISVTYNNES